MAPKASIFLLIAIVFGAPVHAGSALDAGIRDAILRGDWSQQVLLLGPKKGQNFEHDLQLAKALLQLERRGESLKLLNGLAQTFRDERVTKLIRSAGEIFFHQETSNLYFEGLRFLAVGKFTDARERFDQALSKEPGNTLLLTRMLQVEILLDAPDSAAGKLKELQSLAPPSPEVKAYSLKLALLTEDRTESLPQRYAVWLKKPYPTAEVPFVFTLEALKRSGRMDEVKSLASSVLREHSDWGYALSWLHTFAELPTSFRQKLKNQIDHELKSRDRFEKSLEFKMKQTQYFWVGYIRYDDLVKNAR